MQELFELVKMDPETWTPIEKAGPTMRLIGEPQIGDFMASDGVRSVFLCKEVTRVRVSKIEQGQLEIEAGRGIPNWFGQAQQAMAATLDGVFFGGVKMGVGDELVLDGMAIRLEKASEAAAS